MLTPRGAVLGLLLLMGIAATPPAIVAQTPVPSQEQMQQQMQSMTPMFGQMMAAMLKGSLAVLADPETAEQMATFTKNYYDALKKRGFTEEQALRIVISVGVPMPGGAR